MDAGRGVKGKRGIGTGSDSHKTSSGKAATNVIGKGGMKKATPAKKSGKY